MKKKIMILGAGEYQVPLIEAAKNEKYIVIVCDYNPLAIGVGLADVFYEVSTIDVDAVLNIAKIENINGIIGNSEAVMAVVAQVAMELDLVGNTLDSVYNFMSKNRFRNLQKKCNCFCPMHDEVSEFEECKDKIKNYNFPIVIKPSESSGSRGTTKIESLEENELIEIAFRECKKVSRNGMVVIEEYISMKSRYVIEGEIFVNRGVVLFDGLFTTIRSKDALMIPMTYCFPVFLEKYQIEILKRDITKLLASAGIIHGEYNIEAYFTAEEKLFVIEINARQGGNQLPYYVKKHNGIDMYKLLVTTAVDEQYYWDSIVNSTKQECNYIVHHMLYPRNNGKFESINISEVAKKYMTNLYLEKKTGDNIFDSKNATHKIGYVDFQFKTFEQEKEFVSCIEEWVQINIGKA